MPRSVQGNLIKFQGHLVNGYMNLSRFTSKIVRFVKFNLTAWENPGFFKCIAEKKLNINCLCQVFFFCAQQLLPGVGLVGERFC